MTTKNEKATILEMNFTAPILIGGVLITENVINELRYIQTGSSWPIEAKRNNGGYDNLNEYLTDLVFVLIDYLTNEGSESATGKKLIEQIESVYMVRSVIEKLKIPDDLLVA